MTIDTCLAVITNGFFSLIVYTPFLIIINSYFFKRKNTNGKHTKYINIPYTPEGKLNIDNPDS